MRIVRISDAGIAMGLTVLTQWRARGCDAVSFDRSANDLTTWWRGSARADDTSRKKPFQIDELVVRLGLFIAKPKKSSRRHQLGTLHLIRTTGAICSTSPLARTSLEARILRTLVQKQGSLVSRIELATISMNATPIVVQFIGGVGISRTGERSEQQDRCCRARDIRLDGTRKHRRSLIRGLMAAMFLTMEDDIRRRGGLFASGLSRNARRDMDTAGSVDCDRFIGGLSFDRTAQLF